MVKPRGPTHNKPSQTQSYLLLAVKVLLVVVIILLLPKLVQTSKLFDTTKRRRRVAKRQYASLRSACEGNTCGELIPEESAMCVSKCISPACHDRVYDGDPLEFGEVDIRRAREFEKCAKHELRRSTRRNEWQVDI